MKWEGGPRGDRGPSSLRGILGFYPSRQGAPSFQYWIGHLCFGNRPIPLATSLRQNPVQLCPLLNPGQSSARIRSPHWEEQTYEHIYLSLAEVHSCPKSCSFSARPSRRGPETRAIHRLSVPALTAGLREGEDLGRALPEGDRQGPQGPQSLFQHRSRVLVSIQLTWVRGAPRGEIEAPSWGS